MDPTQASPRAGRVLHRKQRVCGVWDGACHRTVPPRMTWTNQANSAKVLLQLVDLASECDRSVQQGIVLVMTLAPTRRHLPSLGISRR